MDAISADTVWNKLAPSDRTGILRDVGLAEPTKPDVRSDETLLATLDAKNLAARRTEAEAIPARVEKARQQAAKLLEPKVQFISVDRPVLKTDADIEDWLDRQRGKLLQAIKNGPVQIQ
jgi:hypothetical protein